MTLAGIGWRRDNTVNDRNSPAGRQRGAVIAEFAVLLPVIVLLLFAIIELGVAFNQRQAINGAAREGARVASLPTTSQGDACARALDAVGGIAFVAGPTCEWSGGCAGTADRVTVTLRATTELRIPFWPGSGMLDMQGTGDFRCE